MTYTPMQLAEAFLKTGELDDALDALNQQLQQAPDDRSARRLRMRVALRLGDDAHLALAERDFQALKSSSVEDYQTASVIYERRGAPAQAIATIRQAIQEDPDNERLTQRLLDLLTVSGDLETALQLVRQQPRTWRWLEREGDLLVAMGDDTLATARYGLVLAQLDAREGQLRADYLAAFKGRVLLARAHAYRRLQQLDVAAEHYRAAQDLLPPDPAIAFNQGLLRYLATDFDDAIMQCQTALDIASDFQREAMLDSIAGDDLYTDLYTALTLSG